MSSDIYSVDTGNLAAVGSSLTTIADTISGDRQYGDLAGADEYGELTGAVSDYCGGWDGPLSDMVESCQDLGSAAQDVAITYGALDSTLASAWSGGGPVAGGGNGGGGSGSW